MTKIVEREMSFEDFLGNAADDHSGAFAAVRSRLVNRDGLRLVDRVRDLTPVYSRVFRDIAVGYAALICIVGLVCFGESLGVSPFLLAPAGAVLIAYCSLYLASFIHEAAHWNLAPTRRTNDRLCNWLLSWFIGLEVRFYRKVHFEHHRSLGTVHDTEFSYFFALNAVFIAKSLTGIRAVQTLLSYRNSEAAAHRKPSPDKKADADRSALLMPLASASVHGLLVALLWWFGFPAAAAAWLFGIALGLPLLAGVRQILEHRSDTADPRIDYSKINQGASTRLFGGGLFARTFGSAGFNRHLLHHWEPQISYTRLGDLERFLAETPLSTVMDRRRSSYAETFRRLFSLY